jgi:hypothetical protein
MQQKLIQFLAYLKHERHALPNSVIFEDVDHKAIRDFLRTSCW